MEKGELKTQNPQSKVVPSPGVGIDIVEVGRIGRAVEAHGKRFLDRLFTVRELKYAAGKRRQTETLAGRFAAKEAFVKAIGHRPPWREIEVLERSGRPFVVFRGREYEGVSISHERSHAVSVVVLGCEPPRDATILRRPAREEAS